MLIGCDGGFYVTYDRGANWDHLNTLALGQFYHVAVDNRQPYRVYGGLQDNGSWGGPSRTPAAAPARSTRTGSFVSGGDGFVCRVDPTDPDLVYCREPGRAMGRRNLRTGERGGIRPRAGEGGRAATASTGTRRSSCRTTTRASSTAAASTCSARSSRATT